jgi:rhodanese-related sulfurtransferase
MTDAVEHYRNKLAHETDAWDLREMQREGVDVVVIDTRSASAFAREHIPGAISLPHREMNEGALKLTEFGFRVKELIGGIEWWKRDGYPTESTVVEIIPTSNR